MALGGEGFGALQHGAAAADEVVVAGVGVGERGLDEGEGGFYHGEAAPVDADAVADKVDVGQGGEAACQAGGLGVVVDVVVRLGVAGGVGGDVGQGLVGEDKVGGHGGGLVGLCFRLPLNRAGLGRGG